MNVGCLSSSDPGLPHFAESVISMGGTEGNLFLVKTSMPLMLRGAPWGAQHAAVMGARRLWIGGEGLLSPIATQTLTEISMQ